MNERPNILILLADQHRSSALGCAGNPDVQTPHLDAMASKGTCFTRCVSSHPLCAPYRASLQTGQFPHIHGVAFNDQEVDHDLPTLAGCFNDAGYSTAFFGKGHWCRKVKPGYVKPNERLGWQHWVGWNNGHEDYDMPTFDEVDNPWLQEPRWEERPPHDMTWPRRHDYATRYVPHVQTTLVQQWVESLPSDAPWIAQVNWGPPHNISNEAGFRDPETVALSRRLNQELGFGLSDAVFESYIPWLTAFPQHLVSPVVPTAYLDRYDPATLALDSNVSAPIASLVRYQLQQYYAQISALDDLVGQINDWLEETGRAQDTIVVYTSDHGDWLGSHADPDAVLTQGRGLRGKGSPHAVSCRVPLIVSCLGRIVQSIDDVPLGTQDLAATLCGLAGFDQPSAWPGRNLASRCFGLVSDASGDREECVLLTMLHWRAIYDGRFTYALSVDSDQIKPWLLFDQREDPHELQNRIDDPGYEDIQSKLHLGLLRKSADAGLN